MNTNFDFDNEMIFGRKHLNNLVFDKKKYDFVSVVSKLFECELNDIHNWTDIKYDLFSSDMLGKDTHTVFHEKFFNKLDSEQGWPELIELYDKFVVEVVLPYLGLDEALVQITPNFRVHLPDNIAVVVEHYDSDERHKHPHGEINFIFALTDMEDTNSVWVEKTPRFRNFIPIVQKAGDCISFNGNKNTHFNKINKTGKSRASFDFRILPLNYYNKDTESCSVTTNRRYIEGGYYKRISTDHNKVYKARDIWDKQKEKFNSTMIKYGVSDAWGVVDIFEKRMAEYAGSKYAVSVDNCTDALFLCLKYLNATGEVILPSKTWISVPCTVIHAGCSVKFEDIEWSGAYQLKPYPIYDGAVRMKKGMYKPGTYHCLSFHIRKHIPIGKGGMILTDDKDAYDWLRTVRYEGRHIDKDGVNYILYKNDTMDTIGWNMYMTPEQAARGLELFDKISDDNPDQESSGTCKDLSKFPIYTSPFKNEVDNYSFDYWFNNKEHDNWFQGGEQYYVNIFYENIIMNLDIPKEGKILILGTHNCVSFDKLCKHFGYDRCIGYDLHNPTNHPNVVIKDCSLLSDSDKLDIAFCHNDLGNYATTPKLKEHAQKWAAKNIIKGGYMLSNNNYNRAKVDNISIMKNNGFEIFQLINLQETYDLSKLNFKRIEGYMISKK